MNRSYQHKSNHHEGPAIASQTLSESILHEVFQHCVPKHQIYDQSCQQVYQLETSVVELFNARPDVQGNNIHDCGECRVVPVSFKVKAVKSAKGVAQNRLKWQHKNISTHHNPQIQQNSQLETNCIVRGNKRQIKKSMGQRQQQNCSLETPVLSYNQNMSKLVRLKTHESTKQKENNNVQMIKLFRANNFIKARPYEEFKQTKNTENQSQIQQKKKQTIIMNLSTNININKKVIALNTDYNGEAWVQINKNQLKKQVNHFIEMEAQVLEIPKDPETQLKKNKSSPKNFDYMNFKELKVVDRENSFVIGTFRLPKSRQAGIDKNKHGESSIYEGKNIRPPKVGFNVFQKLKNNIFSMKQQQLICSQKTTTSQISKLKRKQITKTKKTEPTQNQKPQNITVKSEIALSYLLEDSCWVPPSIQIQKKKVTIADGVLEF